jgi:tripartite ATP-independent transporter DctM subunit
LTLTVFTGFQTINRGLATALEWLLAPALLVMSITLLLQVYFRYIAQSPLPWSEELSRYLLVWLTFGGGALAYQRSAHVSLSLLPDWLKPRPRAALQAFIAASVLLFALTLMCSGYQFMLRNHAQLSPAMRLPMSLPNAALPLGGLLLALFALEQLWQALRQRPALGLLLPLLGLWSLLAAVVAARGFGLEFAAELATWTSYFSIPLLIATVFLALLILGVPIAFVIALTALIALLAAGSRLVLLPSRMFAGTDSFPLLAVPLFVLAGALMSTGGITTRLVEFAQALVGWIRGGLALVNIQASMFFAGISGSAVADASAVGGVMIPAMEKQGYDKDFSAAVTAASSTVGPIIPPSIPLILYGILAQVSIGALFIAGIIPGLLLGLGMMLLTYVIAKRRGYAAQAWAGWRQLWRSFRQAFWALLTPVIILGGILSGVFTPTEASAVAVGYAFIAGTLIYRELKLRMLPKLLIDSVVITALIMLVIAAAQVLAFVFARQRIPELVGTLLLSISDSLWVLLPLVNILLLIVGTFLETTAALIIFIPILVPVMASVGVDPLWFGIIMVLNLVIGMVTPPVGVVLFVTSGIARLRFERLVMAIWPYIVVMLIVLALVSAFPILSLGLPELFGYY